VTVFVLTGVTSELITLVVDKQQVLLGETPFFFGGHAEFRILITYNKQTMFLTYVSRDTILNIYFHQTRLTSVESFEFAAAFCQIS
jgi:hypothetical protein